MPTIETLRAIAAAFNAHDIDAILGFFAEDAAMQMPRGPDPFGTRYTGKSEIRAGLAARFAGLPDVHYGQDEHFVSGNTGMSKWVLTGTMASNGQRVEVLGCDFYSFDAAGKVVLKDSYWKIVEPR